MIRLTFAMMMTLAGLLAASRWWHPLALPTPTAPTAAVRAEPGSRLVGLIEAGTLASSWLTEAVEAGQELAEAGRELPPPMPDRSAVEEIPEQADWRDTRAEAEHSDDTALNAETDPVTEAPPDAAVLPPLGRFSEADLDESDDIVRRLLTIYSRLEVQL